MLADENIRAEADSEASYIRGCHYYRNNCVDGLHLSHQDNTFEARVRGQYFYIVTVSFSGQHKIKHYSCDCPAFQKHTKACKHVIAVLKAIQQDWTKFFTTFQALPLTPSAQAMLDFFQRQSIEADKGISEQSSRIALSPTYGFHLYGTRKTSYLEFSIGHDRLYVVKDIPQLLRALQNNQEIVFGKHLTVRPQEALFDDTSAKLLQLLQQVYDEENQRALWAYHSYVGTHSYSAFSEPRRLKLTNTSLLHFFEIMGTQPFSVVINDQKIPEVRITPGRPPVNLSLHAITGGLRLSMELDGDVFYGLDVNFNYIYHRNTIYHVDTIFANYIRPLLQCFHEQRKPEICIPDKAVSDFAAAALPALETIAAVAIDSTVEQNFYKAPLEKRVYLDRFGDGIAAKIEFIYGDTTIYPNTDTAPSSSAHGNKWLVRYSSEEQALLSIFRQHSFYWSDNHLVLADEAAAYDFLQHGLPKLQAMADVFYSDDFSNMKIQPPGRVSAGVRLNSQTDMLEFSLHLEDISPAELLALLAAYKLKKRYHRLPTGAFISLDSPEFQAAAGLIDELALKPADIEKQMASLPKYRALYLDSLARETSDFFLERSSAFKHMVQDIREPQDVEYPVPAGIQGKLREYQKTGFKWLKSLAHYGLGGILADDMGLGKTLQVLTFILSEKDSRRAPSLVIAPTSLVYNWQEEVWKFAPSLKAVIISGQPNERMEQLKAIDDADLVITSYGLIKRDIDFYQQRHFAYCFLDEAQHIKNPNTLNAKSVKKIKANSYFALTGTPIENSLTELWSIFDFLLPGYLRSHKVFTSRFEMPIVKQGDQKALQELGRHIKPFILRRMKKAVLKELPEKIESKMINEMTDSQSKLYAAWLLRAKQEFETAVSANGFEKSQIKILSLLTRLRQICCHPSLFIEDYQGGSGKLEMLQELLEDATNGGHRVLLFSQFTGMLGLIKAELTRMNIDYHYLDGTTKAEDRLKLVNSFNAGDKSVFLISLKAGGTGLNLTGADMVIHYDPWWNPAVEDQATDRAYRIGQKNSVQVYKLITKDTIEEKIYLLQQKKQEMIDSLIKPGENFLTKMTEAEVRGLFNL